MVRPAFSSRNCGLGIGERVAALVPLSGGLGLGVRIRLGRLAPRLELLLELGEAVRLGRLDRVVLYAGAVEHFG